MAARMGILNRARALTVSVAILVGLAGAAGPAAAGDATRAWIVCNPAFIVIGLVVVGEPLYPCVSSAQDGSTVEMIGHGTFSPARGEATGAGHVILRDADGGAQGAAAFAVTGFVSFESYGTMDAPMQNLEGGLLVLRVSLVPGGDATLVVDCLVGAPPPEAEEGIRLLLDDGPAYDTIEGGGTVYVRAA